MAGLDIGIHTGIDCNIENAKEIQEYILKVVKVLGDDLLCRFNTAHTFSIEEDDGILAYSDFEIFIYSFNWKKGYNKAIFSYEKNEILIELNEIEGKLGVNITIEDVLYNRIIANIVNSKSEINNQEALAKEIFEQFERKMIEIYNDKRFLYAYLDRNKVLEYTVSDIRDMVHRYECPYKVLLVERENYIMRYLGK